MESTKIKMYPHENLLRDWAKPPTTTEDQRCSNAENVVRNAINAFPGLKNHDIEVFTQGSYRNGTNVRKESDVDICVCCKDVFFSELPSDMSWSNAGIVDADYTYIQFKDDVGKALRNYLGDQAVKRGKKAFDLHENTYRVDADVVPAFEHRRYYVQNGQLAWLSGTELHPDDGGRIINWPHHNYENGTEKNRLANTRFKKLVRVLKNLRNVMADHGIDAAEPIPSYLIECLVWNVPNDLFGNAEYVDDLRSVLIHLYEYTKADTTCFEWGEVNELKYLFRTTQPWTREVVNQFVISAWNYAELGG
ncbi:MAG: nucleotidyltransferase [Rhodoferax sp.]|nr:nucleotidyltransferase [Rhodoferax sp.]MDP3651115.1 nucleotidyltransferase [Rhodoferax sp.]